MILILIIVGLLKHVNAGYTNFFYTGLPTAPTPTFYLQSEAPYHSFVPQSSALTQLFAPQIRHDYTQQHFPLQYTYSHTQHAQPTGQDQGIHDVTTASSSNSSGPSPVTPTDPIIQPAIVESPGPQGQQDDSVITDADFRNAPIATSVDNRAIENFRGFAFRNDYESGRSHFVFITGPEALSAQKRSQSDETKQSRTTASDSIDTIASSVTPANTDHSIDALVKYLENPPVGIQRFYSINNVLVSRRNEDDIPALPTHLSSSIKSLPFTQTISPLYPLFKSSFALNIETPTATTERNAVSVEKEQETSASQIEVKSVEPENSTITQATSTTTATETAFTSISSNDDTIPATSPRNTTDSSTEKSTMQPIVVE